MDQASPQHTHATPVVQPERLQGERLVQASLWLALIPCAILTLVGAFFFTEKFVFSWLWALIFWFTLVAGALFWVMVHHATDAAWSTVLRRQLENVANRGLPLLILFAPILLFAPDIWEWLNKDPAKDALLAAKYDWYLNPYFTLGRSIFAFAVLILWAWRMRALSQKQDYDGDPKWTKHARVWAFLGLPAFAVAFTAVAVDWLMALDYKWFSTMWGVYIFAGAGWASMALLIIITAAFQRTGHFKGIVTEEHYHIMGKLLFAFTVFWAYIAYSQYMLIWYANIPEETSYFLVRNSGWWQLTSTLLFVLHFVVPFLLLLPRNLPFAPFISKKNPLYLMIAGAFVLGVQALDLYVVIMPERASMEVSERIENLREERAALQAEVSAQSEKDDALLQAVGPEFARGLQEAASGGEDVPVVAADPIRAIDRKIDRAVSNFGPDLKWIWLDLACLGTIGLLLAIRYLGDAAQRPLFPARDPRILESIELKN